MSVALGGSWATGLRCSKTDESASHEQPRFLSTSGAPWLVEYELDEVRGASLRAALPQRAWSLWRYRELLPVRRPPEGGTWLGEGGTPLLRLRRSAPEGIELWMKDESGNPTGSFKARGLALAVHRAVELGAPGVELPSAGNAALAVSAYAAAAGLPCRVAIPTVTPGAIPERCRDYGAEVILAGDTLADSATRLASELGDYWNLATLKEPYRVEGKKTMGLELAEQFDWELPDWIVYPTGGGTGIVGMWRAFDQLRRLGLVGSKRPRFAVVQAEGCAPLVRAWDKGAEHAEPWPDAQSRAWGLRVPMAIGDFLVLRALRESEGAAVAVSEADIRGAERAAGRREGVLVGPEGGAALAAVDVLARAGRIEPGQRVVVFQTGHPANYGAAR